MTLPPGPRLPQLLQTYLVFRRTDPFGRFCQQRYGPTFALRILPWGNTVVVTEVDAVKTVFTGDPEIWRGGEGYEILRPLIGDRSLIVRDEPEHMEARKKLLPCFGKETRERHRELIEAITREEVGRWPTRGPFRLEQAMESIALDVTLRAILGIRDSARLATMHHLVKGVVAVTPTTVLGWLRPSFFERFGPWRRHAEGLARVRAIFRKEIRLRREAIARGEPGEDVLTRLVATKAFEETVLVDQLVTILVAGHETTTSALSWCFERLLRHPTELARAKADDAYLDAAIKETLRLRPILPVVPRRLAAAATLAGYELPAGTTVMIGARLVHLSPELFPDPHRFQPERFLDGAGHTYDWLPFGGGSRRCLGASFALFELRTVIRTVLDSFEMRPDRPRDEAIRVKNVGYAPARGARVVVGAPA